MSEYLLYIFIASLTIASPGPGVLLTITNTLNFNLKSSFLGILGVAAGMGVISILAASSLGILIVSSPYALIIVKLLGAIYLAYLGIKLFKSTPKKLEQSQEDIILRSRLSRFRQGFFVSLLNPKPIVFFMALFPQFIDIKKPFLFQFALLSLTFCFLVILIHAVYGFFAQKVKSKLSSGKAFIYLNRIGGSVFMLFSFGLILSAIMPYLS